MKDNPEIVNEIPKEKPCSCIKFTLDEIQVILYAITNVNIKMADPAFPHFLSSIGKLKQIHDNFKK